MPRGTLWHTKEGDLDLGFVFLIPFLVLALVGWVCAARGVWTVSVAMWSFLGSLISSLLICAVPIARARLLARATLPGEVAHGIASSPVEPDLWHDDERGEHTEREPVE